MSLLRLWLSRPVLLLLGAWPWLATCSGYEPLLSFTRSVSSLFCHTLPGRALMLGGEEMPVCSRCAGLLLGASLGAVLRRPRLTERQLSFGFAVLASVMLAHVGAQALGLISVHHPSRLLTGLALGWVASVRLATCVRPWPRTRARGQS